MGKFAPSQGMPDAPPGTQFVLNPVEPRPMTQGGTPAQANRASLNRRFDLDRRLREQFVPGQGAKTLFGTPERTEESLTPRSTRQLLDIAEGPDIGGVGANVLLGREAPSLQETKTLDEVGPVERITGDVGLEAIPDPAEEAAKRQRSGQLRRRGQGLRSTQLSGSSGPLGGSGNIRRKTLLGE